MNQTLPAPVHSSRKKPRRMQEGCRRTDYISEQYNSLNMPFLSITKMKLIAKRQSARGCSPLGAGGAGSVDKQQVEVKKQWIREVVIITIITAFFQYTK